MVNELSFAVKFTREQIEEILKDASAVSIIVSGRYTYAGGGRWEMEAEGTGYDGNEKSIASSQRPCPMPC